MKLLVCTPQHHSHDLAPYSSTPAKGLLTPTTPRKKGVTVTQLCPRFRTERHGRKARLVDAWMSQPERAGH